MTSNTNIIPVASGKGGVGKSLLTANLAIYLANEGHKTVAIDLDLGGSNLYSHIGLKNIYPGIGDHLNNKKGTLNDYLVDTDFDNLKFLPGDGKAAFMANMPYAQKVKLIREIKNIEADFILLDLGAGTSYNTLDYFTLANDGIVITTFEKPSIMNTLSFLKNFVFRIVLKEVKKNSMVAELLKEEYKKADVSDSLSIDFILKQIKEVDANLSLQIEDQCNALFPRIVFNKGDHPDDLVIAEHFEKAVDKILSLELCFFGFIFYDENVRKTTKKSKVLFEEFPESIASLGIKNIAKRIVKFNNQRIANSRELLNNDTLKKYEQWKEQLV